MPFTDEKRKEVRQLTRDLNEDGLRALAVAYKWMPPEDRTYTVADEKDLVLAGYVAFLDPPKETAREAIAALKEYGVAIKIITGDNEVVTRKICKEVGLAIENIHAGQGCGGLVRCGTRRQPRNARRSSPRCRRCRSPA